MSNRFDSVGLWWQDYAPPPTARAARTEVTRIVEPPVTGWKPPTEFPNLSSVKVLGIDTETKDLDLLTRGPGAVRGAAHAVGVSVATDDAAWYFPIRHEYGKEQSMNMAPERVFAWLTDVFARPVSIVGANLMYDLEVLKAEGVPLPTGELFDVQYAEPLLDETRGSYSLDSLAQKYLGEGKRSDVLYDWCAQSFGGQADGKQRANIWRAPPSLVGPYAEGDAQQALLILQQQRRALHEKNLTDVFRMECGLIPLLLAMRFRGVPVDVEKAEQVLVWLKDQARQAQESLGDVDVWSGESIARVFDKVGAEYVRTAAGNPSFTKEWLTDCTHPLAANILLVRQYEKAANPFVESYILGAVHNGRVHCQFHPLRSDNYGTVSGRFSSSNPNLQNIPSRDKVLGPLLRGLFVPEQGCVWRRSDYSQIEYRLLGHFAVGRSQEAKKNAEEIRRRYNADPKTDFHREAINMIDERTGIVLERTPAKNFNFGMVYGMGKDKLIQSLGVTREVGEQLYEAYFTALPAVKDTHSSAMRLANRRGYIKTLLGRRRTFDAQEGTNERKGAFAALNACLQGSAADIIKKAMLDCWRAGLFGVTGVPHLTVHDELDWSDDGTPEAATAFAEIEHIMTNCIKLRVPLLLETVTGLNWGACK